MYNVDKICYDWFNSFHNLEKADALATLTEVEIDFNARQAEDKIKGVVRLMDPNRIVAPFDDMHDPDNMGFLP